MIYLEPSKSDLEPSESDWEPPGSIWQPSKPDWKKQDYNNSSYRCFTSCIILLLLFVASRSSIFELHGEQHCNEKIEDTQGYADLGTFLNTVTDNYLEFDDDLQTSQSMPRVQAITDDIPEPMMMDLGCDGKGVGMFWRAYRKSQGKEDDFHRNGFDIAMENDRKHGRQVTFYYFFLYS